MIQTSTAGYVKMATTQLEIRKIKWLIMKLITMVSNDIGVVVGKFYCLMHWTRVRGTGAVGSSSNG